MLFCFAFVVWFVFDIAGVWFVLPIGGWVVGGLFVELWVVVGIWLLVWWLLLVVLLGVVVLFAVGGFG